MSGERFSSDDEPRLSGEPSLPDSRERGPREGESARAGGALTGPPLPSGPAPLDESGTTRDPSLAPSGPAARRRGFEPLSAAPLVLGLLTLVSTTISFPLFGVDVRVIPAIFMPPRLDVIAELFVAGLPFGLAVMAFFFAHEMGHYLACKRYEIPSTRPYFIPAPFLGIGTFGAVIRIRGRIPDRRALFDIGVAGPLAGFAVALPLIVVGVLSAELVPEGPVRPGTIIFGDSFLTWLLARVLRPESAGMELVVGPLFIAGWVGLLATAMNLFPAGQLDGGHIVYALLPRWHRAFSLATGLFLLSLVLTRWFVHGQFSAWTVWVLVVFLFARRHPPLPQLGSELGPWRRSLALAAALIFALAFMPHPLELAGAPF